MAISTSGTWCWIRDAIESHWVQWATKLQYSPVLYCTKTGDSEVRPQVRSGRGGLSFPSARNEEKKGN
jgi:hypothetical protein